MAEICTREKEHQWEAYKCRFVWRLLGYSLTSWHIPLWLYAHGRKCGVILGIIRRRRSKNGRLIRRHHLVVSSRLLPSSNVDWVLHLPNNLVMHFWPIGIYTPLNLIIGRFALNTLKTATMMRRRRRPGELLSRSSEDVQA